MLWRGSKQERHPRIRSARRGDLLLTRRTRVHHRDRSHKGSHTAIAIDGDERLVGELLVRADRRQRERLLCWATEFEPRLWAIEGATGTGALLAQQLVRAGETVLDVPPALSARARLLDSGHKDKTDPYDARSAAIVALHNRRLRAVALEDHGQFLRLLARRHHQLTAVRTRAICRLHAVLCEMTEGGLSPRLSAKRAALELRKLRPGDAVGIERKRIASEFLDEVRRVDQALVERAYYFQKQTEGKTRKEAMRCLKRRISDAVYQQLRADTGR